MITKNPTGPRAEAIERQFSDAEEADRRDRRKQLLAELKKAEGWGVDDIRAAQRAEALADERLAKLKAEVEAEKRKRGQARSEGLSLSDRRSTQIERLQRELVEVAGSEYRRILAEFDDEIERWSRMKPETKYGTRMLSGAQTFDSNGPEIARRLTWLQVEAYPQVVALAYLADDESEMYSQYQAVLEGAPKVRPYDQLKPRQVVSNP